MNTLTNEIVSEERLCELFASFADDKHIQEQFGDGDYANESGDIMSIIAEVKALRAQLASLPADWSKDSSLETWFPLSAEHIARLEAQLAELRGQASQSNPPEHLLPKGNARDVAWRRGAFIEGWKARPVPPAENILFEPEPTDSANAPLSFSPDQDTAWVVGAEWMREAFKKANKHLKLAGDDDHSPQTVSQPVAWQWFYLKQWHVTNDPERARDVAEGGVEVQPLGVCSASQPSYRDGIEAAAKWLDKQRESFDNEHGRHDPDTGTFEFGSDAQLEHSSTLAELSEGIRALQPAASQPVAWRWFDGRGYNSTTDKKQADELVKDGVSVEALGPLQAPAASQPVTDWKDEFSGACLTLATITDLLDIPADDVNGEPSQIFDAIEALKQRASQPYTVPIGGVTAEHQRVIEMLLKVCGAAFELADDTCEQEVDGEQCITASSDSFAKLSDALDEIENTLPTEDADRPDVFLAWAAMPRAALKSILQSGNSPAWIGIDWAKGCGPVAHVDERAKGHGSICWTKTGRELNLKHGTPLFVGNSPVIPDGWVPEGYALVPVEPTPEMIAAAMNSDDVTFDTKDETLFYVHHDAIYAAMIAAAPQHRGE
ncbi:hypothetical protein J5069_08695 [Candidatus Symbiopectobacterium sp. NZEC127]|uniref:hypothetical protein n=1 Tax=Candidatus Symbiopectobacterium sp. NZEC127 TaxID=2820472 RepID=UPI00222623CC|nr:hypothetical protein [Candidatus Symbiopectobacterium sp. NZEC127]MCW2485972.1 hypothetical protein [Candidatus Symbiopectobacterium sp. NZEC127]